MPCEPSVAADSTLPVVVAALRTDGAPTVAIGVVGPGARELRSGMPETAVYELHVDEGLPLEVVAGQVFPAPQRCLIVARRTANGWDWRIAPTTLDAWGPWGKGGERLPRPCRSMAPRSSAGRWGAASD